MAKNCTTCDGLTEHKIDISFNCANLQYLIVALPTINIEANREFKDRKIGLFKQVLLCACLQLIYFLGDKPAARI
jgi:hypothetical protein